VALLTVEGENDDISGVGQTEAAHDLCPNIPDDMRVHYVQPEVGHYGVFNGSRFRGDRAAHRRLRAFQQCELRRRLACGSNGKLRG
jgi:poly(3-hydroxybutyrate) depolymerase